MGFIIRNNHTGNENLPLDQIDCGLKEIDPEFSIIPDQAAPNTGDVLHGGEVYGEIEINGREDQVLTEDIEDLREQLEEIVDDAKATVLVALDGATGMLAFQLSEVGHEHYRKIDPFWDWLFEHYAGLLQIDEEGYYTQSEQLLEVD